MSPFTSRAMHQAALQTFVGDLYAAIYDPPWSWSRYAWCTDLDMEPHRISRIVTLDMKIEGDKVLSQPVLFLTDRDSRHRPVLIAFNDVGEMIFSDYVHNARMIHVRPELTAYAF